MFNWQKLLFLIFTFQEFVTSIDDVIYIYGKNDSEIMKVSGNM